MRKTSRQAMPPRNSTKIVTPFFEKMQASGSLSESVAGFFSTTGP